MLWSTIRNLFQRSDLLQEAYQEARTMLTTAQQIFVASVAQILDDQPCPMDLRQEDRTINAREMDIRRKVLEHLSTRPAEDIGAALVLITILGNIERLGDLSKLIDRLYREHGGPLPPCEYTAQLRAGTELVREMFAETVDAFSSENPVEAAQVITSHQQVRKTCLQITEQMLSLQESSMATRHAIAITLYARNLLRIASNLKTICTAVTQPFDRIGYAKQGAREVRDL